MAIFLNDLMDSTLNESLFDPTIYMKDKYVILPHFPMRQFDLDVKKTFKNRNVLAMLSWEDRAIFSFRTLRIHQFFVPELLYILDKLPERSYYNFLTNQLLTNTWAKRLVENIPNTPLNIRDLVSDLNVTLKPYQMDFFKKYLDGKYKYMLRGYILAFEQGLGKTITSLSLMRALGKTSVIIITPKNTMHSVWVNEINKIFKSEKKIWFPGKPGVKSNYYIVNYEMISKLDEIRGLLGESKNVGLIVDECHNFRHLKTKRVTDLRDLVETVDCQDILLMSGTPIKALGYELIPSLYILDRMFDEEAMKVFMRITRNSNIGLEILQNRIRLIMHRKLKTDVLELPDKNYRDIKIKFPGSDKYTLKNVKVLVQEFIDERIKFYNKNKKKYDDDFDECIDYLKSILSDDGEFIRWLEYINYLRRYNFSINDSYIKENLQWANEYERTFLIDQLPSDLKIKFRNAKTVVKYVSLRILGEVLGGYLNKLRSEMYEKAIQYSPTCKIINNAEKKTIVYTTFVPIVKYLEKYVRTECGNDPILVYGENKNVSQSIKDFKTTNQNPLIATIQSLSLGVTLIEANTIIFINPPWRSTDKQQAEDRVHRIGQDTVVNIFSYSIDTGNEPNLSTRMDEIIDWSKTLFSTIMEPEEADKIVTIYRNKFL